MSIFMVDPYGGYIMPNIKAKKKSVKKSAAKRLVNRSRRSAMKTSIKNVLTLIEENKKTEAVSEINGLYKIIDKATTKNLIHKNKAARLKSKISKKINGLA
jgi:small subunit ribosomal protein S20